MLPFVRRGLALVSIDYRLARQATAPAAVEDCLAALAWLGRHGAARGLDPRRVVVIGASAGGHLALMLAFVHGHPGAPPFTRPRDPGAEQVAVVGAVDLYGVTDVLDVATGPRARPWARQWVPDGPDQAARARLVSPLAWVRTGVPPVLIVHSSADDVVPYEHATRLHAALREVGARAKLVTIPGAGHSFFTDAQLAVVERDVGAFLRRLGVLDR
jgi:acetyl esterase/lipase